MNKSEPPAMGRFEAGADGLRSAVIHQQCRIGAVVTNVELAYNAYVFYSDALRLHLCTSAALDIAKNALQLRHQIIAQTCLHGLLAHEPPVGKTHTVGRQYSGIGVDKNA